MEHAVPQNVTSFEFRLIGDMTLKQFSFLASGCALAYLTFLILFSHSAQISLFFMAAFALSGALFAFVPISDRPLDHWVKAFFRAIYSPTSGWWKNPLVKNKKAEKIDPIFTNRLQNYLVSHNLEISPPLRLLQQSSGQVRSVQANPQQYPATAGPKLIRMAPPPQLPQPILTTLPPKLPPPPPSTLTLPPKFQPVTPVVTIEEKPKMVQKSLLLTSLPNVVNGMVTDFSGNYIENVIVIIHNAEGIPVRASKTNKLGQFSGATPLPAGEYNVTFEKEGLNFETLKVNLNNEVLPALNIQPMKGAL
ncbi:MAG: PrgI family protein [Candidatus Daviesbacteria bacterium]|nr:PrgI family protein [Candidatus Daviesbacteria bacterium]